MSDVLRQQPTQQERTYGLKEPKNHVRNKRADGQWPSGVVVGFGHSLALL